MMTIFIISTMVAIVVSFLCSLAESLLLSLNPLMLHRLDQSHPRAAESWRRLKRRISHPITAILVLNTVAHTGGATVAGGAFTEIYGEHKVWIFSTVFTVIILLGTEILPKIIGVTFRNQLAPYAGPVLETLTFLLRPFVLFSELIFNRLTSEQESEQITTADLITLASLARSGKAINLEQENMIVNVVRLGHTSVVHAMIPREQIQFIKKGASAAEIVELARRGGHTRYPVSRSGTARDIFAFVEIKRVIPASAGDIERLLSSPVLLESVGQHACLMTALQLMLRHKTHLLSVTDEQGHCVGILTLEDIAGELFGADVEDFR